MDVVKTMERHLRDTRESPATLEALLLLLSSKTETGVQETRQETLASLDDQLDRSVNVEKRPGHGSTLRRYMSKCSNVGTPRDIQISTFGK